MKNVIREKTVEEYLKVKVKNMHGVAYKFISPGNNGMPDRLVCLPGGKIFFVELKALNKKTRALQDLQIKKLQNLGCRVFVVDSFEGIDKLLEEIT